ncbi:MAG: hypothetical protein JWO36_4480 [Myxococcales bacterium]|nr:hypothetical protein [Myxococcales bacterium]
MLSGGAAHAKTRLDDAVAQQDLEQLRSQLPNPSASCWLSLVYEKRGDLPRAGLHLENCNEAQVAADVRDELARAVRELRKTLRDSELSEVYVQTQPAGLVAEIDALPGEHFTTPATVWVPAGHHEVHAISEGIAFTTSITTKPHSRALILLEAAKPKTASTRTGVVEFGEEGDVGDKQDGPPPDVKHGTMLPKKYIDGGTTAGAEEIADPLAVHERRSVPLHPPALRTGLRVGGGTFGHAGGSRIAPSVAMILKIAAPWEPIGARRPIELGVRLDWSRRGGDDAKFEAIGFQAEVDRIVAATDSAWIAAGLALRGDARTAAMIGTMPVRSFGLGGCASIELVVRDLPIVFGVRYEQGITELADGLREHAVLLEAGVDLRQFHDRR